MGPLGKALRKLRLQSAAAAQAEYDAWQQDDEGCDEELGCGGICDRISQAIGAVIAGELAGVTVLDGGQDGDDHAFLLVFAQEGPYVDPQAYIVDILPGVYETGCGYSWRKRESVVLAADDVVVEPIGPVEDYVEDVRENPAAPPVGDCFAVAVQLAKKYGGEIVHGKVLWKHRRIWHAWVEFGTPLQRVMVRDEGQPHGVALSVYYRELKPRVAARYTVTEAQIMALRTGHWGPWV